MEFLVVILVVVHVAERDACEEYERVVDLPLGLEDDRVDEEEATEYEEEGETPLQVEVEHHSRVLAADTRVDRSDVETVLRVLLVRVLVDEE